MYAHYVFQNLVLRLQVFTFFAPIGSVDCPFHHWRDAVHEAAWNITTRHVPELLTRLPFVYVLATRKHEKTAIWQRPYSEPGVFTVIMAWRKPEPCVFIVLLECMKPEPGIFTLFSRRKPRACQKHLKTSA